MNIKNKKFIFGFTIIEVMLVVVLIGIIAAFAIPNYEKTVEKATERRIYTNIQMIKGSLQIYEARYGQYPQIDLNSLTEINTELSMNASDDKVDYGYLANTNGLYRIEADPDDYPWFLHVHTAPVTYIHCAAPGCPACLDTHDPIPKACPY